MTTALLWCGIVGTVGFVTVFVVDGATRPGYDWRRHAVSALALGPRGWLQTSNFVVCGLLVTAAASGIRLATDAVVLPASVAVFGVALVLSGVFPMDPMRAYPPGTPDQDPTGFTTRHKMHDLAGMVVFGSMPVMAVAAALTLPSTPMRAYSAAAAVATAVLAVAFSTAWERDLSWTGLVQRTAIVAGWTWLAALCWYLLP
ncbi:MAG: DUF998 domain-containing protein [Actinobacteria bacterium]|jgi:hypothetical protein|nr:DUF998 domain-containing protein [Actinomycetota bacterium]